MARRMQDITIVEALLGEEVVGDTESWQSFSTSLSKLMTEIAWPCLPSIMWETSDQLSFSNIKIWSIRTASHQPYFSPPVDENRL